MIEKKTMSVKTSPFAPKPYGAPMKPKPLVKPNFLSDENKGNLSVTNKPIISNKELSTFQLRKSVKTPHTNDSKSNPNEQAEFQKISLKSPHERREERQESVSNKSPRKTPPTIPKKPPTDDELRVKHEEDKSIEQIKNEAEINKLPVGGVRNSKMLLFEKLGKEPEPIPVRRRNRSNEGGSFVSTSSNEETTEPPPRPLSSFKPKAPPKTMIKPGITPKKPSIKFVETEVVPVIPISPTLLSPAEPTKMEPKADELQQDDIYDDVANQQKQPAEEPVEEEEQPIYDDVNEQQQQQQERQRQQQQIQQQLQEQIQPQEQFNRESVETRQDLYDDVLNRPVSLVTPTEEVTQDDTYDTVVDSKQIPPTSMSTVVTSRPLPRPTSTPTPLAPSQSIDFAPLKTEKPFDDLPEEKYEIPEGLSEWLQSTIAENNYRLKKLDDNNNDIAKFAPPPRAPIVQKDFTLSNSKKESTASRPVESEKDRIKREKREKKEKLKKEKEEQKRKEDERKRRTKELKSFGLSPDVEFKRGGIYICQDDFTTKEKLHINYTTGDELTVIEVADQYKLKGKMVVMNLTDKKVGYVSKADFDISEDEITPEVTRANDQSKQQIPTSIIIPTEPEEDTLYDEIEQKPPPVPCTPRPQLPAQPIEAEEDTIYETL